MSIKLAGEALDPKISPINGGRDPVGATLGPCFDILFSHSFFDVFWARFSLHVGPLLESCWLLFRIKWGDAIRRSPLFCWVYVIFRFGGPHGPLLAPFGLDF